MKHSITTTFCPACGNVEEREGIHHYLKRFCSVCGVEKKLNRGKKKIG